MHIPSLFMARHHGHRLQLQFSANRFWNRNGHKHEALGLPAFPGLSSVPPTVSCWEAMDRVTSGFACSPGIGQGTQLGGIPRNPANPPIFCSAGSYSSCNAQFQCHLLWEAFSDALVRGAGWPPLCSSELPWTSGHSPVKWGVQ